MLSWFEICFLYQCLLCNTKSIILREMMNNQSSPLSLLMNNDTKSSPFPCARIILCRFSLVSFWATHIGVSRHRVFHLWFLRAWMSICLHQGSCNRLNLLWKLKLILVFRYRWLACQQGFLGHLWHRWQMVRYTKHRRCWREFAQMLSVPFSETARSIYFNEVAVVSLILHHYAWTIPSFRIVTLHILHVALVSNLQFAEWTWELIDCFRCPVVTVAKCILLGLPCIPPEWSVISIWVFFQAVA